MIEIGTYENFLKMLETTISEQKIHVERMMIDCENEEDKKKIQELKIMTSTIEEALKNKDIDTLNKIISDANSSNR